MALEGFFPKDIYGISASLFSDFRQALPILSFLLSVGASTFGTSKFFLIGPLRLLSQKAPLSGILSFTFLTTLIANASFVFRVHAIEHIFFSTFQNYTYEPFVETFGTLTSQIEPILPHNLRLPLYFLPILPSIALNIFSLRRSLNFQTLIKLFFVFPQYFIAPGFIPLMFEGITKDDKEQTTCNFKIKVWKLGSIINAIYIIWFPQIFLVMSDVLRGVTTWEFILVKDSEDSWTLEKIVLYSSISMEM